LRQIYGTDHTTEEYFCNYEVNAAYDIQFREAGLVVSARGPQYEVRAIEIPDHTFFIATLFQPQLSSRAAEHPLIAAYLRSAVSDQGSRKATS